MSSAVRTARILAGVPKVTAKVGTFIEMDGPLAVVTVGSSVLRLPLEGWYPPIPGEPVRIQSVDGNMRVTGPNRALNPRGEISATAPVDPLKAVVTVDGVDYEMSWAGSYTPMTGDVVVINWNVPIILGEESTAPTPTVPDTPTLPSSSFDNLLVQATSSGGYFGGTLRRDDPWASPSNDGAWFYSGGLSALAGANITRVEIYLPLFYDANYGSGDLCQVGRHGNQDRPGTTPSLSALTTLSPESGWVGLPADWGNHFRDNPSNGVGVIVPSSGFFRWRGVPSDGMSGALRFAGTR